MILTSTLLDDYARWQRWRRATWFLTCAQVFDLLTMLLVITLVGIDAEINPFLRLVWDISGAGGLVAVKLSFTLLIYGMAQLVDRGDRLLLLAGAMTLLLGASLNVWVLVQLAAH